MYQVAILHQNIITWTVYQVQSLYLCAFHSQEGNDADNWTVDAQKYHRAIPLDRPASIQNRVSDGRDTHFWVEGGLDWFEGEEGGDGGDDCSEGVGDRKIEGLNMCEQVK